MLCGGAGEEQSATAEVQALVDHVRSDVEQELEGPPEEFEAVKFRSQVVAGTNFFVKVHLGGGQHVHARIYRDLQGVVSLQGVQKEKEERDSIEYF